MPLPFIPLILTPLVFAVAKKVSDKAQAEADAAKASDAAAEIPEVSPEPLGALEEAATPEPIVLEAATPLFPLTASSTAEGHDPSLAGDSDLETFWQSAEPRGWLQLTLPSMQEVQRITLSEAKGEQIQLFAVEYRLTDDGQWRTLFAGEKIGALLVEEVPPTLAQAIRIHILASDAPPAIAEFSVA